MAKICVICKKELSDENKGFLCQYCKDKAKENIQKIGAAAAGTGIAFVTFWKTANEHKDEFADAAKQAVNTVKDIPKF